MSVDNMLCSEDTIFYRWTRKVLVLGKVQGSESEVQDLQGLEAGFDEDHGFYFNPWLVLGLCLLWKASLSAGCIIRAMDCTCQCHPSGTSCAEWQA